MKMVITSIVEGPRFEQYPNFPTDPPGHRRGRELPSRYRLEVENVEAVAPEDVARLALIMGGPLFVDVTFPERRGASAPSAEEVDMVDEQAMADHRKMLAVVQVLRDVEWQSVDVSGDFTCPHCWGVKPTHRAHCPLAAAIRG
jgi:hypothetical protein